MIESDGGAERTVGTEGSGDAAELEEFVSAYMPRLRAALSALAGGDAVDEAVAETLLHLSRQPKRVMEMENPRGYLYQVARSKLPGSRRKEPVLVPVPPAVIPESEPGLPAALAALPARQRVSVFLVVGLGWSAREVADVLDIAPTSVHTHCQRGLAKLRRHLGEVSP